MILRLCFVSLKNKKLVHFLGINFESEFRQIPNLR